MLKNLLLKGSSYLIPFSMIIKITRQSIFLPLYHTVQGHQPLPHIHHLYPPKSIAQFEKDLDYILKYYQPITLEELTQIVLGKKRRVENVFHLTFDDGLSEIYNFIAPILKRKGIPATIFLNSDFINNKNLFYRYKASLIIEEFQKQKIDSLYLPKQKINVDKSKILSINYKSKSLLDVIAKEIGLDFDNFLITNQPYLSGQQIEALINDGFSFGAHSIDHPFYGELTFEEQLYQTTHSLDEVTKKFNLPYNAFAFPFSDSVVSNPFFEKMNEEYENILTFGTEIFPIRNMLTNLQRISMEGNLLNVETLLKTKLLYYYYYYYYFKTNN